MLKNLALFVLFLSLTTTNLKAITPEQRTGAVLLSGITFVINSMVWKIRDNNRNRLIKHDRVACDQYLASLDHKSRKMITGPSENDFRWHYRNVGKCLALSAFAHYLSLASELRTTDHVNGYAAAFLSLLGELVVLTAMDRLIGYRPKTTIMIPLPNNEIAIILLDKL